MYSSRGLGQLSFRGLGAATPSAAIQAQITAAAAAAGVPANLAIGIAAHESGGIPTAQNPAGSACGIFQLTSATQQYLGVTNCTDPTQNINGGISLLQSYYQKYGNWADAIQAFSDGPATVGVSPPSAQTLQLESYLTANWGVDLGSPSSTTVSAQPFFGTTTDPTTGLPTLAPVDIDLSSLGLPDFTIDPTWLLAGTVVLGFVLVMAFRK
jgi:hypothetical protein